MLLQSHAGEIHMLPALPRAWKRGRVRGLRARGGFEVDISWDDGVLTNAVIRSHLGGKCQIRYDVPIIIKGRDIFLENNEKGTITFDTDIGQNYIISRNKMLSPKIL